MLFFWPKDFTFVCPTELADLADQQDKLASLGARVVVSGRTQAKLDALGFKGVLRGPISTSCADHVGTSAARIHTWDGSKWVFSSDWIQADMQIIKPMVKTTAERYAAEKKLTARTAADCQS